LDEHERDSLARTMTLSELVGEIDTSRQQGNLSSAIRLFVLDLCVPKTLSELMTW
jgi:predicted DNA-binding ribbon-helix-helix protein